MRHEFAALPLVGLALGFAALELGAGMLGPYGLFHDELYYWAGSRRLELGYVDHPPLAPWILAATTTVLGDGRLVFGLVPAVFGAMTLVLTGTMAQRFGAGRFGQMLAALAAAVVPFNLILFSFYSVNAFEIFFWTLATFLFVELIRTGDERLWFAIGGVAGVALLNKHTFVLLGFGFAVAVSASPLRAHLRRRWLWLGVIAALLLALPNVYWNYEHGWPSLAFYRSRPLADLPASVLEALALQLLGANPVTAVVWIAGAGYLLLAERTRPYRPIGIAFLVLFLVILLSGHRRGDRIAGIYPVVLGAGGAFWDQVRGRWATIARWVLPVLTLAGGALVAPAALPLVSPEAVEDYFEFLGEKPEIETADVGSGIPLYLIGRLEWERFAAEVTAVYDRLPTRDQARAVVLAPHWVFASVVEYYGRDRPLPPVVAPHNAYYFWRGDAAGRDVAVSVGVPPAVLLRYFADTQVAGSFRCEACGSFRLDVPIVVARGPVRPLEKLLAEWRHFGIYSAPSLM